jgi:hypothetical protein
MKRKIIMLIVDDIPIINMRVSTEVKSSGQPQAKAV